MKVCIRMMGYPNHLKQASLSILRHNTNIIKADQENKWGNLCTEAQVKPMGTYLARLILRRTRSTSPFSIPTCTRMNCNLTKNNWVDFWWVDEIKQFLDGKSGDIHGLRSLPQGLKTENSDKLTAPIRMMNEIYRFVEKKTETSPKKKKENYQMEIYIFWTTICYISTATNLLDFFHERTIKMAWW